MINAAYQSVKVRTISYLENGDVSLAIKYLLTQAYRKDNRISRNLAVEYVTGLAQVSAAAQKMAYTELKEILKEIYEEAVSEGLGEPN